MRRRAGWFALAVASVCGPCLAQTEPVLSGIPDLTTIETEPLTEVTALPFASPRDAARYRMQRALATYRERNDARAARKEVLQAILIDPSYDIALYNLAVLSEAAADWDSAAGFYDEFLKRSPGALKDAVTSALPRTQLLLKMSRDPKGKARRTYDAELVRTSERDAATKDAAQRFELWSKLAAIDAERYEAFACIGALLADQGKIAEALESLTLAAKFAPLQENTGLDRMLARATREYRYGTAIRTARQALALREYRKASEGFDRAWQAAPDQAVNGLHAAAALLAADDTVNAVRILARVRQSPVTAAATRAEAMLKTLRGIEPAAETALASPRRPTPLPIAAPSGPYERMLPQFVRKEMRLLTQESLKVSEDNDPVRLIDSMLASGAGQTSSTPDMLNQASSPLVSGEKPFVEFESARVARSEPPVQPLLSTADRAGKVTRGVRTIPIHTTPPAAEVFFDDETSPVCATPCELKLAGVKHKLRVALAGYMAEEMPVTARTPEEWTVALQRQRGQIIVDAAEPGAQLLVNEKPAAFSLPVRLSLPIGVHKLEAKSRNGIASTFITVVPDKMLRVTVGK